MKSETCKQINITVSLDKGINNILFRNNKIHFNHLFYTQDTQTIRIKITALVEYETMRKKSVSHDFVSGVTPIKTGALKKCKKVLH